MNEFAQRKFASASRNRTDCAGQTSVAGLGLLHGIEGGGVILLYEPKKTRVYYYFFFFNGVM